MQPNKGCWFQRCTKSLANPVCQREKGGKGVTASPTVPHHIIFFTHTGRGLGKLSITEAPSWPDALAPLAWGQAYRACFCTNKACWVSQEQQWAKQKTLYTTGHNDSAARPFSVQDDHLPPPKECRWEISPVQN